MLLPVQKIFSRVAVSASLLAACGTSPQLEPRFVAVHNTMTAVGLAQTGPISQGSLPGGAEARVDVELTGGECYTFLGLGDSGVDDLDLRVVAEGEEVLASDGTHDRQAALQVCPARSGDYQVVVSMAEGSGGYLLSSWSGSVPRGAPMMGAGGTSRGPVRGGPGSCAEPLELTLGQPVTGDTTGVANELVAPCAPGEAPERVYRLELPNRMQVTAALSSSFDGVLYILSNCNDVRSAIDCNDDSPDTSHSRIETTLEAGTYYVVVDGYGDAAGSYELQVDAQAVRPIADVCSAAPAIVPGQPIAGSTNGQVDYFRATCASGARNPDQVYRLQIDQRSRVRARQTSDHDGALHIRSTCADPNSEVACNDDFRDTHHSQIVTVLDPGEYFVISDGFSSNQNRTGNFELTVDLASPGAATAPANNCAAPGSFPSATGGSIEFDAFEASDDFQGSCGGAGASDLAYNFRVTSRSRIDVTRTGGAQPVLYLQRGCGAGSQEIACQAQQNDPRRRGPSAFSQNLTPGDYTLVIDGASAQDFVSGTIQVAITDLTAMERDCRAAPMLRPGRTVEGTTSGQDDRFQASCAGDARSSDRVYRLRLRRRSRVLLELEGTYDAALYIRRDCVDASTEVACNDDHGDSNRSRIETTLDAGTYYVVVDGFAAGNAGNYSLRTTVSRP